MHGVDVASRERVSCILCGRDDTRPIAERGQFGIPVSVAICPHDGLVYLNPRWTRQRYLRFYSEEYDTHYRPDAHDERSRETRFATSEQIWRRLEAHGRRTTASVLDVGAGMGWSLEHVRRRLGDRVDVAAIEASERCVENLRALGVELLTRDLESGWSRGHEGRFDLIVLRHVLEHTLDPVRVLTEIRHALAPGGALYLAVPDMMHPRGSLGDYWFRVVHTYYFSSPTLAATLGRAGLTPEVLEPEGAEIWGICRVAGSPAAAFPQPSPATYEAQMAVIARHRRAEPARRLTALLRRVAARVTPPGLRRRLSGAPTRPR